jgi:hypothetical protein
MRALSQMSTWLSHPRTKATWVALAAGSLAGLAVLGACSDTPVSKVAAPGITSIPGPRFGVVGDVNHRIVLCVDPTSSAGTYNFSIVPDVLLPPATAPWFELPTSSDPNFGGVPTQNTLGPFDPGDVISPTAALTPGDCEDVFVRMNTCPGSDPTATPPVLGTCDPLDAFDNAGNRLWGFAFGVINPYGAVDITATIPAGYTHSIVCTNDDPGLPQTCTNGGYTAANVFHGSSFTFRFVAPAGGCTLTLGWWKNQGAATSAQFDFDGGTNNGLDVLNTKPKGNAYYILAHQYIAAALNVANGATLDGAALAAFNAATAYFAVASPANPLPAGYTKDDVTDLADVLDDYNNGVIGPGHCDD